MTRVGAKRLRFDALESRHLLTSAGFDFASDAQTVHMSSESPEPAASDEYVMPFPNAEVMGDVSAAKLTSGILGTDERADYYSIHLSRPATLYSILFNADTDLSLAVYDQTGEIRAHSQTPGLEMERLSVELSSGTYYLMVLGSGESNTIYQMGAVSIPLYGDVYESAGTDQGGDSFGRATLVGSVLGGKNYQDTVGGTDPADVYRIRLEADTKVYVGLQDLTGPVDLHLFSLNGQLMARSRNAGTQSEALSAELAPGDYYVLVFPTSSQSSAYHLSMTALGSSTAPPPTTTPSDTNPRPNTPPSTGDAGDTFGRSLDLGSIQEPSWVRKEVVGGTDATDVFRFQLATAGRVAVELRGMSADLDLYLFDSNQRVIARNYQSGAASERVEADLTTAPHFLLVIPHGPVESAYELAMNTQLSSTPTPPTPPAGNSFRLADVPDYGSSLDWNLNRIGAPEAWAAGFTGKNVVVAVIDSGVDRTHTDLQSSLWENVREVPNDGLDNDQNGYIDDRFGWNFVDDNANISDPTGHGTHIAGIIASARNGVGSTGVAYDAKVMPLRVLNQTGGGRTSDVASAIIYAADQGADIISLSLFSDGYSSSIENALLYAQQKGVFVAAAAGNQGAAVPNYPARHSANMDHVLSVGAHTEGDQRASFSNRVGDSEAIQIDAPGVSINSTVPVAQYGLWYGTSMATPHVAAAAALILSANPQLLPGEVRNLLVQTASRAIANSDSRGGLDLATAIPLAMKVGTNRSVAASWETVNWMPVREEQGVFSSGQATLAAALQFELQRADRHRRK